STGLSWKADYVALFDEGASKLDLQGWVTLSNTSGTPFVNAETKLVAGQVQVGDDDTGDDSGRRIRGVVHGGTEAHTRPGGARADSSIYSLPERTTIAQTQTKRVSSVAARGVPPQKVYQGNAEELVSAPEPSHAAVGVDFSNPPGGGLGAGLPAGT